MQASVSDFVCTDCGERFRTSMAMQQHIDQTRHMNSQAAYVSDDLLLDYRVEGDEKIFYCRRCHKSLTTWAAVLQHHASKHSAPKKTFYRRCGNCNMEQTTAFGWLNHRGDCKKVPLDIRNKIKLVGLKCIASPETCSLRCAGIGMILHLKDEHGIDIDYFEDDFAEKIQKAGLVEILTDDVTRGLPQFEGLNQQFELSEQSNSERLKKLNEARLRVIHSEGEDLAARRAREFEGYMEWLQIEQSKLEHERRMKILREKEDACAAAAEAEKRLTDERRQNAAAVLAEVRVVFEKTSALVKSNQTAAAKDEVQQMVLKLQRQSESAEKHLMKETDEYKMQTRADVLQLQEQLGKVKDLKSAVKRIVDRVAACRIQTQSQSYDRHNVAPEWREKLGLHPAAALAQGVLSYDQSMTVEDILMQEYKHYGKSRNPEKVWVPSYNWVKSCRVFQEKENQYRQLCEAFLTSMNSNTSKCGHAFKGLCSKVDEEIFETWYVVEYTFDDCHYFLRNLMGLKIKQFITDPVLFFQAICLRACNTERFGDNVMNSFVRMMHADHPDFADSASVVDMTIVKNDDGDADAGDFASSAQKKSVIKEKQGGSFHNNLVKFSCCISTHLRFVLQDALPIFSAKLLALLPSGQEGSQFDYTATLGEKYSIVFGSVFYLVIMEARKHLKCHPPRVREYVSACLRIGVDVEITRIGSKRLVLPWQDVVKSVRASQFLSSDDLPSHADWLDILPDSMNESGKEEWGKNERDSHQILAELISSDVRVLGEKWALLDSAYESPAKGFFDFECHSKVVFESALQESTPPLFPDSRVFEDWWIALSKFRCRKDINKRQGVLHDLQRFEPPNARLKFWDNSAQALWLLEFITFCRRIMFEEYDKPQSMKKRPAESADPPTKTFRNFFDFVSSEMLNYDEEKKEKMMINRGTAEVKIIHNFTEWLDDHKDNLSRKK